MLTWEIKSDVSIFIFKFTIFIMVLILLAGHLNFPLVGLNNRHLVTYSLGYSRCFFGHKCIAKPIVNSEHI